MKAQKVLAPIFAPDSPDAIKDHARRAASRGLEIAEARLQSRETLLEGGFSSADAYLFWALLLMPHAGILIDEYPALQRYHALHIERPTAREVLAFERRQHETPFAA